MDTSQLDQAITQSAGKTTELFARDWLEHSGKHGLKDGATDLSETTLHRSSRAKLNRQRELARSHSALYSFNTHLTLLRVMLHRRVSADPVKTESAASR